MHAAMHTECLYVNAWDAISAYDFACIDRVRAALGGDGEALRAMSAALGVTAGRGGQSICMGFYYGNKDL